MGLFGKRQPDLSEVLARVAALETQHAETLKQFRKLRDEVQEDLDRAYRHRKAAEARERGARAAAAEGQGDPAAPDGTAPPQPPPALRPVQLRRWLRQHTANGNGS